MKTYQYRLYPTRNQLNTFNNSLELCRQLYNIALSQRITCYKKYNKSLNYYDQANQLKELKEYFEEYRLIYSQVLQDVFKRLDKAFKNFFRRIKRSETPGFPRFKGYDRYDSLTYPQFNLKIQDNKIYVPKIGYVKIKFHRNFPKDVKIKTATIKKSHNKYYVNIAFETQKVKKIKQIDKNKIIGIDLGLEKFLITSDNKIVENPRFFKVSEKKVKIENQKLSKKVKGSNNRKKQRQKLSKVHEKIGNQRKDFCHKLSRKFVDNFDIIIHENLNIKRIVQNKRFSKSIVDVSWFQFIQFLTYKAEEAGKYMIGINPKNTTQMCSNCGKIVKKDITVRIHSCSCGYEADRDLNAAINIKNLGLSGQGLSEELVKFKLRQEA